LSINRNCGTGWGPSPAGSRPTSPGSKLRALVEGARLASRSLWPRLMSLIHHSMRFAWARFIRSASGLSCPCLCPLRSPRPARRRRAA
jgi:hypothetical protein